MKSIVDKLSKLIDKQYMFDVAYSLNPYLQRNQIQVTHEWEVISVHEYMYVYFLFMFMFHHLCIISYLSLH